MKNCIYFMLILSLNYVGFMSKGQFFKSTPQNLESANYIMLLLS